MEVQTRVLSLTQGLEKNPFTDTITECKLQFRNRKSNTLRLSLSTNGKQKDLLSHQLVFDKHLLLRQK